jgi:NodT family efflux transporter outer membrane factor (OMF) lipoprotein
LTALLLAACATHSPVTPDTAVPAAFEHAPGIGSGDAAAPAGRWHHGFGSDELDALIQSAAIGNLDIAAAAARVAQADARSRVAGTSLLPHVDAGANVAHFSGRAGGRSANETDWSALASASYEVDFWGKNRASAKAGAALARASRADRDTVDITVTSSVANSYFQLLSLRERLSIAHANLDSAREILKVIEARFNAGAASAADLATQRATVASTELAIPDLVQQESAMLGALALLLGRAPEQFMVSGIALESLHEPAVDAGLPSALLTRRPDLIAAEATLEAASADVAAARAALLPTLTLTGAGGLQNPAVQAAVDTLTGTGGTLTIGASLLQSIFDGGRQRAVRAGALARQQELLALYRGSVLAALLDVETALSAIKNLDVRKSAQLEYLMQGERAFQGAQLRYKAGSGDYLGVLEAQRLLYVAREQASVYRLARLQALVALYKALGGGWQSTTR